jgi:uncharacterized protein
LKAKDALHCQCVQPLKPNSSDLLRLGVFLVFILLVGALLAPPLFQWAQPTVSEWRALPASAQTWPINEMVKAGFDRYFNRLVQISALLGLIWLAMTSRQRGRVLPRMQLGSKGIQQSLLGFGIAGGFLLLLGWCYCQTGVYALRKEAPWLGLGTPLLAALGAGIVEELIFRGLILGMLLRSLSPLKAVLWATSFFALVHFLKPPADYVLAAEQVNATSGFALIGQIFAHFGQWNFILAEFGTLFMVGWVLAWVRLHTDSLWPCVGLHAGWVFGLKYFSALTKTSQPLRDGDYLPWIGENLKVGLLPMIIVFVSGGVALWAFRKVPNAPIKRRHLKDRWV